MHTPADDWESFFHVLSWVVLRFTRHGLRPGQLANELRYTYDSAYVYNGEIHSGGGKRSSVKSRHMPSGAEIPPGPLFDLLEELADVFAGRYEDPPSRKTQEQYERILQLVARDRSLEAIVTDQLVKLYRDRKEKLKASWMLKRFRDAVDSDSWDLGPEGQRFENLLNEVDEEPVTKKRSSEFGTGMPATKKRQCEYYVTDVPRQSKRYNMSPNSGGNATNLGGR